MDRNNQTPETIDDYIAQFAPEIQALLQSVRKVIHESVPEAAEKISYQMPAFALHGNLVHFAAFKHHIGFYPGASGIAAFQNELSSYKGAKGSVQFPLGQPLPYELISRITKFRAAESKAKSQAKAEAKAEAKAKKK